MPPAKSESLRVLEPFDRIDNKYLRMLNAGLSRQMIESALRADGHDPSGIIEFWKNAAAQSMREALEYANEPNGAWEVLKPFQKFMKVEAVDPSVPCPSGYTRFVCISDTHGLHEHAKVPDGDVLLHAGDFTDTGEKEEVIAFSKWLRQLPHKYKVVVAGNHESTFQPEYYARHYLKYGHKEKQDPEEVRSLLSNCVYLEDELVVINGFRIYGSPWQPDFCNWAFNLPRGDALAKKWRAIPDNIDVLLTHSPPLGRGDIVCETEHVGCVNLLNEVQFRLRPKFHVFGHVHESYGVSSDGYTTYINASVCDDEYQPCHPCIVFDLPNPSGPATDQYQAFRYEKLKRRASIDLDEVPVRQKAVGKGCKHPRPGFPLIEGSDADLIFQKKLEARRHLEEGQNDGFEEYPYSARAMKYVFTGPFREIIYARRRERMKIEEVPDYTLPDEVFKPEPKLPGRGGRGVPMVRRFTDSLLQIELSDMPGVPRESTEPTLQEEEEEEARRTSQHHPEESHELPMSGRNANRRGRLAKRKASRFLPTISGIDEDTAESENLNTSSRQDTAAFEDENRLGTENSGLDEDASNNMAATRSRSNSMELLVNVNEECTLCQLNVLGHVHDGKTPLAPCIDKPLSKKLILEGQCMERTTQMDSGPVKEECVLCKFKVSGHRHEGLGTNNLPSIEKDEVPSESKPEPNQTVPSVDCVLCTFKVAGHVHGGKPPPPLPLTVDEESAHLASMLATTQIGMPPSEENLGAARRQDLDETEQGLRQSASTDKLIRLREASSSTWF